MQISEESYNKILTDIINSKRSATIIEKRSRKEIFFKNNYTFNFIKQKDKLFDVGTLNKKQVNSFFALVSKAVKKYIILNDFKIENITLIKHDYRGFNIDAFKKIPVGDYFICFDLNNAYWQMMNRLKIINDETYLKYKPFSDYRVLKQVAIGLTTSIRKAKFIINGEYVKNDKGKDLVITEDLNQWKQVYQNVRYSCYNVPIQVIDLIGEENYIFFNQDAVAVSCDVANDVDIFYRENNYSYKKVLCTKISDTSYKFGAEVRNVKP